MKYFYLVFERIVHQSIDKLLKITETNLPGSIKLCCPFSGISCQFLDQCVTKNCSVHSKCITDPHGNATCICLPGLTGMLCASDIDECSLDFNPCEIDGECQNTFGSYKCHCNRGFTGQRCEESINECLSDPCKNGAVCADDTSNYQCFCKPGWTGKNCEIGISNPYQNGGPSEDELNQNTWNQGNTFYIRISLKKRKILDKNFRSSPGCQLCIKKGPFVFHKDPH